MEGDPDYRESWADLGRRRRHFLFFWLGWVPVGGGIMFALVVAVHALRKIGISTPDAAIIVFFVALIAVWGYFFVTTFFRLGAFLCPRCGGNGIVNLWRRHCPNCGLRRFAPSKQPLETNAGRYDA